MTDQLQIGFFLGGGVCVFQTVAVWAKHSVHVIALCLCLSSFKKRTEAEKEKKGQDLFQVTVK